MKVFDKKGFVNFVRENEYLYLENRYVGSKDDNFDNDMSIVNEIVKEDGIYGLEFGSRGEVEFKKIDNFVEDLIEWNSVSNKENEFRDIVNEFEEYLDLNWEEELSISYFIIKGE